MKAVSLGELEKQIMDILWLEKKCSSRDVLIKLDKKLAYTTVATVLQRLFDKGLVSRKEDKWGYIYKPKLSKEKYSQHMADSLLSSFINSFGDTAIASFVDSIDKLPEQKRKYFLELLNDHDKHK